ncbi:phosphoadenosine phosphosulfate reductase [Betaproteobacteria bacterium]|nr:phosphoadenosine phosphosulfate reductase [Betaproteobacteria bacterium]GHU43712.1 phosphoadenosine phosphosulfate reductase [Betaproteobacteria bacterium]
MSDFTPLPHRQSVQNPATHPELTPELLQSLKTKTDAALALLRRIASAYAPAVFANSLGAEDMVLTDLILNNKLPLGIFSLDTGRLPTETYDLMAATEKHYNTRFAVFYPERAALENFVHTNGINAFYESVALRQTCCRIRKVEPLARALAGNKAWITGMRAAQSGTRQNLAVQTRDAEHGLEKFNPLLAWSEQEVWAYIRKHDVPYNPLHDQFYPSIGCAPCTRSLSIGEDIRAGRWWWENPETRECGLHVKQRLAASTNTP